MSTFIHKDGQQFGPYSDSDLEQLLRSGQLSPNDLAWREGMQDWQPVGRLLGGNVSVAVPPPPPLPPAAPTGKTPPKKEKSKVASVVTAIVVAVVVLGQINNLTKSDEDPQIDSSGAPSSEYGSSINGSTQSPDLELLSWHWELGAGALGRVHGEVRNASRDPIRSVEVIASFYDTDQRFISSYKAMVQFNPLLPGQTSPFRITFPPNPAMSTAKLDFGVFLGKPLITTYNDAATKPQGSGPVGASTSGTQFSSIEEAQRYALGVWTDADRPSTGLWTRWVVKENGTLEEYSAPATSDDWGQPSVKAYQMVTGKYDDTGKRYYGLKLSGGYTAIIRPDGRLRMGLSEEYLVKGDRLPFSK